jgi:hypothetical protein
MKTGQEMANQTGITHERNRNNHIEERRSNTEKAMTPSSETDFLTQVLTVSPCEHQQSGNRWTGTAEMRCFLMEALDENIRDLSGTPSSNENALAYCLQAIVETES